VGDARRPGGAAAGPGEPRSRDAWVFVNGERRALPAGAALLDLLGDLRITPETPAVAVAVNDRVVPRAEWAAHGLAPGDRIEVVRPMQGG
jgi:sulfur carrier protein